MSDEKVSETDAGPGAEAAAARAEADAATEAAIDARPTSADYSIAFSPRNLAVGFAVVAGLLAIIARRRRGARRDPD